MPCALPKMQPDAYGLCHVHHLELRLARTEASMFSAGHQAVVPQFGFVRHVSTTVVRAQTAGDLAGQARALAQVAQMPRSEHPLPSQLQAAAHPTSNSSRVAFAFSQWHTHLLVARSYGKRCTLQSIPKCRAEHRHLGLKANTNAMQAAKQAEATLLQ